MSELKSRLIGESGRYTKIGDDMTWPSLDQGDFEWRLRYGSEDELIKERFIMASIVQAYSELINLPQKQRNAICKSLKSAE